VGHLHSTAADVRNDFLINIIKRYIYISQTSQQVNYIDLGCGDGEFANEFMRRMQIKHLGGIGLDISHKHLLKAVNRDIQYQSYIQYVQGDLEARLPFRDSCFDIVSLISSLEHVIHKFPLMQEVGRILRGRGLVIIQNPNPYFPLDIHYHVPFFALYPRSIQAVVKNYMDKWRSKRYGLTLGVDTYFLEYIPISRLIRICKKSGFDILSVVSYHYPTELYPWWAQFPIFRSVVRYLPPMGHILVLTKATTKADSNL